jgi:hypothetical protein
MALFRERPLARLVEARAISKELVAKLHGWRHPGFSAHVGERIAREDKQRLEDTAAYLVKNPLSLKKLVYLDGQLAVLYRSKLNPFLGDRVRGQRQPPGAEPIPVPAEPPRKRCSASRARLIAKVYEVDPLVCRRCGKRIRETGGLAGSRRRYFICALPSQVAMTLPSGQFSASRYAPPPVSPSNLPVPPM